MDDVKRRSSDGVYLSVAEVAEELQAALPTVYNWIRMDRVEAVRNPLSGTLAISQAEVDRVKPYVRSRSPG
jgi:predicted site-specific integrase-resolvase